MLKTFFIFFNKKFAELKIITTFALANQQR